MVTRIAAPNATRSEGLASPLNTASQVARKARATTAAAAQALPPAARKAAGAVQKNVRRAATGMLGLSGERMSKVDTAWLRMDSGSNLMMINGVWTLAPGIAWEALCERVQQRLLQYPRFRQRVVEDAAIGRGGCKVDTATNQIDAQAASRWARLTNALGKNIEWLGP